MYGEGVVPKWHTQICLDFELFGKLGHEKLLTIFLNEVEFVVVVCCVADFGAPITPRRIDLSRPGLVAHEEEDNKVR